MSVDVERNEPYRGPDRRGVARFSVPVAWPTVVLLALALAWALGAPYLDVTVSNPTITEIGAVAATLAVTAGIGSGLRWRLDGIALGWWCGWGLIIIGVGQLAIEPLSTSARLDLGILVAAYVLFVRAVAGPEIDATIRAASTAVVLAAAGVAGTALALSFGTTETATRVALGLLGAAWIALALIAVWRRRTRALTADAGWVIPVAVALGLAELLHAVVEPRSAAALADRGFELFAMLLASIGAVGGLVRAAVHHRTRALREHIEHERELTNRRRVEESFADRLHEMRSTVVAIEGGVSVFGPRPDETDDEAPDASLRAALIAEIRRLRTLVNESPTAAGVEAFDVAAALRSTVELQRANGQDVSLETDGARSALGRPTEVAQVVQGLLTNAAKYAPGSPVRVRVHHELDEVAIRVEDDGPGIDPAYWDRIFDRGFRVDPTTGPGGSGIGLHVGRSLLRAQDGDLWVEEAHSGGATFVISLPAAPALRVLTGNAEGLPDGNVDTTSPADSAAIQEAQ